MKKQYLLIFFAWLCVCFLGALLFYFSGFFHSFTDALFESVSGFTATGATVLTNVESLPNWFLLCRAMSQWFGGIGILFTVSRLPFFKINSRLMNKETAIYPVFVYIALTVLQFVLLKIFGMDWFDAVAHSFSTVSTGGFSIRNSGITYYNSAAFEWICTVFMFFAGINFSLIWLLFCGKAIDFFRSSETRAYTGIILIAAAIVTASLNVHTSSFGTSLRQAFFHVVSLISTTGFFNVNYNQWPSVSQGVLLFLLFVGGCSGSAAGGIKVIRYVILSKQAVNEMKRIVYPNGVFAVRLDGESTNKKTIRGVAGFVFLYFLIIFLSAILVSSGGADVFTSFNAALVCLGNIGHGLGGTGVFGNFLDFPVYVKWGLCLVMIAGRLELWVATLLLTGSFGRR